MWLICGNDAEEAAARIGRGLNRSENVLLFLKRIDSLESREDGSEKIDELVELTRRVEVGLNGRNRDV